MVNPLLAGAAEPGLFVVRTRQPFELIFSILWCFFFHGVRRLIAQGLQELEPLLPLFPEGVDANGHSLVPFLGLGAVGATNAIPDGEVKAEVAVRFLAYDGVMDPVHIRGHDEETQDGIDLLWQPDVGVVEEGGAVEEDLKDQHGQNRWAEGGDGGELEHHGKDDLHDVKTDAGAGVEVHIAMMDPVESPKDGHRMEHDMLEVDDEIEGHHTEEEGDRIGPVEVVEETPPLIDGEMGHGHTGQRGNKGEYDAAEEDEQCAASWAILQ